MIELHPYLQLIEIFVKRKYQRVLRKYLLQLWQYWSFALQHELPAIANDEDDMTYLRRIRETFIIPIKGKEKII